MAWSSRRGAGKGNSTAWGQGPASSSETWSAGWDADSRWVAGAEYRAKDYGRGHWRQGTSEQWDSTEGGYWYDADEGAEVSWGDHEPFMFPDRWQWIGGRPGDPRATPNRPTTQRRQPSGHKGQGSSSLADTAGEVASGSTEHAWSNYTPDGIPLPDARVGFNVGATTPNKRVTQQHAANKNCGRRANKQLIDALKNCKDFRKFNYPQWLAENWDWEVYQNIQLEKSREPAGGKPRSLPMSAKYFCQVLRGFDAAMVMLSRRDPLDLFRAHDEEEPELVGEPRRQNLGAKLEICEWLGNVRHLTHVTADEDCSLQFCVVAETAAVQLDDESIMEACSDREIVKAVLDTTAAEESHQPSPRCSSDFAGALEAAKHGSQPPAAAAEAADPAWADWRRDAIKSADAAVDNTGFVDYAASVYEAMKEERTFTLEMKVSACKDCLSHLAVLILEELGWPASEVKLSEFGSRRYACDLTKSDLDFLVCLPVEISEKDFLARLVRFMRSDAGQEFGWTGIDSVRGAWDRYQVQARFLQMDCDIVVGHEDEAHHVQSVVGKHLHDALAAQAQVQGAELFDALKMFKVFAWAAKSYCRHKQLLGAQFKSIALIIWAAAVLKGVWNASAVTAEAEKKNAAWMLSYLVAAFHNFPFDTLAVQLGNDKSLSLHKRNALKKNDIAGAFFWVELTVSNSAAWTTPAKVKEVQQASLAFLQSHTDEGSHMAGYHPTDTGFILAQGVRVWGGGPRS